MVIWCWLGGSVVIWLCGDSVMWYCVSLLGSR